MVQSYPRYENDLTIGLIASQKCNIKCTKDGRSLFAGALESVVMWNVRLDKIVSKFVDPSDSHLSTQYEACCLELSPDEREIAVGYTNGSVRIFAIGNASLKVHFTGHDSAITVLRYDSSGQRLASGSRDSEIVIWDVSEEAGIHRLKGHTDIVNDCLFMQSANQLISCSKDSLVKIWDLDIRHCVETIVGQRNEVTALALSADETRLVAVTADQDIRVYRINKENIGRQIENTENVAFEAHFMLNTISKERSVRVLFHPHHPLLIVHKNDRTFEVYRFRQERELHAKQKRKSKRGSAPQPSDELTLVKSVRASSKVRSIDVFQDTSQSSTLNLYCSLFENAFEAHSVDWRTSAPDNDQITGTCQLYGHRGEVRLVALSHHQDVVACVSSDMIKIWNVHSGALVRTIECNQIACLQFLPGDRELIAGTKTGEVEIYDIASGMLIESFRAHNGSVNAIALRPNLRSIATGGSDKEVKFWEIEVVAREDNPALNRMSLVLAETLGLTEEILAMCFSPNEQLLAIAQLDSTIKVFQTQSMKFFLSLFGHKLPCTSISISDDSKLLASASSDKNVKIWGLDFGDCHRSLFAHQETVTGVAFVPNSRLFLSCGRDCIVRLWDAQTFSLVSTYRAHHGAVCSLAVHQGGDFFVSVSADRSIRRWTQTEEPVFLEEERERELETTLDQNLRVEHKGTLSFDVKVASVESLKNCDKVIDAIEMCDAERHAWDEYRQCLERGISATQPPINPHLHRPNGEPIPAVLYVLGIFEKIPATELEAIVLVLPFKIILSLLHYLGEWFEKGYNLILCCRLLQSVVSIHHVILKNANDVKPVIWKLRQNAKNQIRLMLDRYLLNRATFSLLHQEWLSGHQSSFSDADRPSIEEAAITKEKRGFLQ